MKKKPIIVIGLIAINIIVFLILSLLGDVTSPNFMLRHGAMYPTAIDDSHEYWRFFTSNYLHFGFEHLMGNMITLGCAGPILEDALGRGKFITLYTLSGIAGSFLSYTEMVISDEYAVSAGASGAIFGVIGALLWIVLINKGRYKSLTSRGLIFLIVLTFFYGIHEAGTDNWGHVGGLVLGYTLSMIMYRKESPKRHIEKAEY